MPQAEIAVFFETGGFHPLKLSLIVPLLSSEFRRGPGKTRFPPVLTARAGSGGSPSR
jgi:hypothetical protein